VLVTHPYEGGHPDHDALARAVHDATGALAPDVRPVILETPFYHPGPNPHELVWGAFRGDPGRVAPLSPRAGARKRAMFACYRSQAHILANFSLETERVRIAPDYTF
jgi:LmbE family N-acetylglucosaminyl deacetylase